MCGIVAILNWDPQHQVSERLLHKMNETMLNRGPDDVGYWVKGPIGLGHHRLAIIDLSPAGHQPMSNEDGTLWITYNGEIYNFQELREELEKKGHTFRSLTDTEIVLHAYEEWNTECLQFFNGMWAFALWDDRKHHLFVARDRFGIKPLVYFHDHQHFICASEIKGITIDQTVPKDIDAEALHHYLSFMNVPAPFTIYRKIKKLRPGHYLHIKNGQIQDIPYWDLKMVEEVSEDKTQILENLDARLHKSIKSQMVSDVPLGIFLSGGVDSSLVSAIAAQHTVKDRLNTFTVSFQGMENFDESPWAQKIAKHIGSNHHEINCTFDFVKILPQLGHLFDEPFAISSVLALYLMSKEVCKHVKVVLTGDGGDEVFGGYPWRHSLLHEYLDRLNHWPLRGFHRNIEGKPAPLIRWSQSARKIRWSQILGPLRYNADRVRPWMYFQSLYCYNEAEKAKLYTPEWVEQLGPICTDDLLSAVVPVKAPNTLARWLCFDIKTTLADEMLAKVDKATMACGLEARVPFLDHLLVEYAINLPAQMKVQRREGKRILKELGKRYLPSDVLQRHKHGFNVPLKLWFRNRVQPFIYDVLNDFSLRQGGFFRTEVVQEILKRHREDLKSDFSNHIFTLLCFELWRREQNNDFKNLSASL
jgi:asparagine synthase (glutamine-hydrolysing)